MNSKSVVVPYLSGRSTYFVAIVFSSRGHVQEAPHLGIQCTLELKLNISSTRGDEVVKTSSFNRLPRMVRVVF